MVLLNPKQAEGAIASHIIASTPLDDLRCAYRQQTKDTGTQPPKYMALRLAKIAVEEIKLRVTKLASKAA